MENFLLLLILSIASANFCFKKMSSISSSVQRTLFQLKIARESERWIEQQHQYGGESKIPHIAVKNTKKNTNIMISGLP